MIGWNRRSSAPSFSMYLRYSSSVVAPMHWSSPRAERRLQHVGGVDRAFGAAGADDRVQLVDEDDRVLRLADLVHDRLEPLLELAAVLGAGDHRGQIEGDDPLVLERLGNLVLDDALRQALGDRGLADARLADQDRVVLLPAARGPGSRARSRSRGR